MKKITLIILAVLTMASCSSGRAVTLSAQEPQARQEVLVVAPTAGEKARDSRFIAYENGTVLDTRTGLMWAAKDNGNSINWASAKSYCENYSVAGATGWRMPTQDELAELYATDARKDKIKITGWVWASETRGSDAACFANYTGRLYWHRQWDHVNQHFRALPVRSCK